MSIHQNTKQCFIYLSTNLSIYHQYINKSTTVSISTNLSIYHQYINKSTTVSISVFVSTIKPVFNQPINKSTMSIFQVAIFQMFNFPSGNFQSLSLLSAALGLNCSLQSLRVFESFCRRWGGARVLVPPPQFQPLTYQ